ncbi:MAG TPA: MASE1 domain-containing protein [Pyrinomonadaceae bacterium]|jgi:PAS domain S-box-containing protein
MNSRLLRSIGLSAAIALLYFAAAECGLSLASVHTNVSPVWPPTGIAIAALLLLGYRVAPGILLGAFLANLKTGVTIPTATAIGLGNTVEALSAAFLVIRYIGVRVPLYRAKHVVKFAIFAAVFSPMISATIGSMSLCLSGAASWDKFGPLWLTWWLGDGVGALVVAPLLLAWGWTSSAKWQSNRLLEGCLLILSLAVVSMFVFGGWFPTTEKNYPLAHLVFPFFIWAAFRFHQRGVTITIAVLAATALWGTAHGLGPFIASTPNESLLLLQAFMGTITLTALVLTAIVGERKKVEEEKTLLASQVDTERQRLNNIVANVPGVVWEAWGHPDGAGQRINYVSDYVETMLGYSVDEWLATPNFWLSIVHPEDREQAARAAAATFASGKKGTNQFRWVAKDGRVLWVEAQSVAVCNEQGEPVGMRGVTMDITEQKLVDEERAKLLQLEHAARNEAEEANRIKDDFLATLSHELRTPLTAMLGWLGMMRGQRLDESTSAYAFEAVERNARMQAQLIEDLVDVSRIVSGKLKLNVRPMDLTPVVEAAVDAVRPVAEAKQISIQITWEPFIGPVSGDPTRLEQVIWNLLSNAVKFTPTGGSVQVYLRQSESSAVIVIRDTGIGIRPEFLQHVFERFRQADSTTTRAHGGLGLGLAIVRHLVELHGGTVSAESAGQDQGSTFTVRLPLATARTPQDRLLRTADLQDDQSGRTGRALNGVRVLLVEDEADTRTLLALLLAQEGAEVEHTATAEDAIARLATFSPHVLLSDIGLPLEDGYELIRKLRSSPLEAIRQIPAIALTAYATEKDRDLALAAGYQLHLIKPVEPSELIEAVERLAGKLRVP